MRTDSMNQNNEYKAENVELPVAESYIKTTRETLKQQIFHVMEEHGYDFKDIENIAVYTSKRDIGDNQARFSITVKHRDRRSTVKTLGYDFNLLEAEFNSYERTVKTVWRTEI